MKGIFFKAIFLKQFIWNLDFIYLVFRFIQKLPTESLIDNVEFVFWV